MKRSRDWRNCDQGELLDDIATQAMIDRGLLPGFTPEVREQVEQLDDTPPEPAADVRDLTGLLWCSIDNDDSRDLDQLTVAERVEGGTKIRIAVADVDALVPKDSPADRRARHNTTSVYTAARVFPMLPERLSTDLTSLNEGELRLALVIELVVRDDGTIAAEAIERAIVLNKAKLTYNAIGAWLDGESDVPEKAAAVDGLPENLRLQDRAADAMRDLRHENGALILETIEPRAIVSNGKVIDMRVEKRNNARLLIEDFMIAANGVTARFLARHGHPSIRRVVRSPERWDRIERIAEEHGDRLPPEPDARALEQFLKRQRKADPLRFPDLSLSIVKAMGAGEYVVEEPHRKPIGHFGLAVKDYTHSTAPNRRYPDLITHRMVKAALTGTTAPYSFGELDHLAQHCTAQEDAANKVERQVRKSAAACLLADRIDQRFDAIVTGAGPKGTWVRILHPPVEGKLVHGFDGVDVGQKIRVKLIAVDVEAGFIDFVRTR